MSISVATIMQNKTIALGKWITKLNAEACLWTAYRAYVHFSERLLPRGALAFFGEDVLALLRVICEHLHAFLATK